MFFPKDIIDLIIANMTKMKTQHEYNSKIEKGRGTMKCPHRKSDCVICNKLKPTYNLKLVCSHFDKMIGNPLDHLSRSDIFTMFNGYDEYPYIPIDVMKHLKLAPKTMWFYIKSSKYPLDKAMVCDPYLDKKFTELCRCGCVENYINIEGNKRMLKQDRHLKFEFPEVIVLFYGMKSDLHGLELTHQLVKNWKNTNYYHIIKRFVYGHFKRIIADSYGLNIRREYFEPDGNCNNMMTVLDKLALYTNKSFYNPLEFENVLTFADCVNETVEWVKRYVRQLLFEEPYCLIEECDIDVLRKYYKIFGICSELVGYCSKNKTKIVDILEEGNEQSDEHIQIKNYLTVLDENKHELFDKLIDELECVKLRKKREFLHYEYIRVMCSNQHCSDNEVFVCACRDGLLEIAKFLYYEIGGIDIHYNNDSPWWNAHLNRHSDIQRWLHCLEPSYCFTHSYATKKN